MEALFRIFVMKMQAELKERKFIVFLVPLSLSLFSFLPPRTTATRIFWGCTPRLFLQTDWLPSFTSSTLLPRETNEDISYRCLQRILSPWKHLLAFPPKTDMVLGEQKKKTLRRRRRRRRWTEEEEKETPKQKVWSDGR